MKWKLANILLVFFGSTCRLRQTPKPQQLVLLVVVSSLPWLAILTSWLRTVGLNSESFPFSWMIGGGAPVLRRAAKRGGLGHVLQTALWPPEAA